MPSSCLRQWVVLPCVITYTVLTNNVLVCVIRLFGDMENTITIWRYCAKFLFLCLKLCQLYGMFCHALDFNVSRLCLLGISHLASLLQGIVEFEPYKLSLYSFVHLFIPPPGFVSLLVVLEETAYFDGSIHLSPSDLTKLTQCDQ